MTIKETGNKGPFGKKELKVLYASYGEFDLYNSGNFKPLTRNLTTGKMLKRGHHCEQCNGKMSQFCYDAFHHAYCPTWVTRTREGKRIRLRCGERFALHSDGCGKHPRVQGYNEPLYRAAAGYDVDLSEFDDPDPGDLKGDPEDDEEDYEAEQEELELIVEKIIEEDGCLPNDFYAIYWRDRARNKSFAMSKTAGTLPTEPNAEDEDEAMAVACRGQVNIVTNGKAGAGRKSKKRGITFADGSCERHSQGRKVGFTYGGRETVSQPIDGKQNPPRSYAPKGSKPKAPMEVPRRAASGSKNKEKENGKKRVGEWWKRVAGLD